MALVKKKNRRRGPDAVIKLINTISLVSWIIIFGILIVFSLAKPRFQGFDRNLTMLGGSWDRNILSVALYLMILQIFLSIAGILFNVTRMKRRSDKISKTLVFSGGMAVLGILLYALFI